MGKENRRLFFKKIGSGLFSFSALGGLFGFLAVKKKTTRPQTRTSVHFTTGFKILEVTAGAAIVWTRLCAQDMPNPIRHQRREQVFRHPIAFDEDQPVATMDGGVKGCAGIIKIKISDGNREHISEWLEATGDNDFTVSTHFANLHPDVLYRVEIQGKASPTAYSSYVHGTFRTAPGPTVVKQVNLVTSTCQYFWSFDDERRGFKTYDSMRKLKPDFFIHTGDYVYYDKPGPLAKTIEKARHKWHAMDSWSSIRQFFESVPVYMVKDDHDLLKNDVYRGMSPYGELSFEDGLKLWYENVPLPGRPYRTVRWGKDIQVWMVEGREFRSPNDIADSEEKSIWGKEQKKWFMETVEASDATFKLLFTATPVVGPDREKKKDNHANEVFRTEGEWLREYLSKQRGMYVVNGDRHWQYVSKDTETGLVEFGSGPVSDYHAQGWDPADVMPEHRFLRLKGGFLNIRVDREDDRPFIAFSHYDVDGDVVHRERFGG